MPVFHFFYHFYKTHIATPRIHQHYCDQAMRVLKTSNFVRTLECHLTLLNAIFLSFAISQ